MQQPTLHDLFTFGHVLRFDQFNVNLDQTLLFAYEENDMSE